MAKSFIYVTQEQELLMISQKKKKKKRKENEVKFFKITVTKLLTERRVI